MASQTSAKKLAAVRAHLKTGTHSQHKQKQPQDDLRKEVTALRARLRELEALNDSKDEFVSLASHQLRTPATAIKQLLGILLEGYTGTLAPEQHQLIQKAYACNDRQLATVNSLLRVAQLDAGKIVLQKTYVDIPSLLQCIVEDYAGTFDMRGQRYFIDTAETILPAVSLDSDKFSMAMENIIDNASKYTPAGGEVRIIFSTNDRKVSICISDSGVGIPEQQLDKLFMRFGRAHNDLPGVTPGSGLGLYWAEKVIRLHGGTVTVASQLGKGTAFTVCIPADFKSNV